MSTREIVTAQSGAWRYRGGGGITSESQSQSQSDGRQDGRVCVSGSLSSSNDSTNAVVGGRTATDRKGGGRAGTRDRF